MPDSDIVRTKMQPTSSLDVEHLATWERIRATRRVRPLSESETSLGRALESVLRRRGLIL